MRHQTNRGICTLRMLPLEAHEVMGLIMFVGFVFPYDGDMVDSVPCIDVLSSAEALLHGDLTQPRRRT